MNTPCLSEHCSLVDFELGDMVARYQLKGGRVAWSLLPKDQMGNLVERVSSRPLHPELSIKKFRETFNEGSDSLVHVSIRGQAASGGWTAGASMRNNAATDSLEFDGQRVVRESDAVTVETTLISPLGFRVRHQLLWREGDSAVRIQTEVVNDGTEVLLVEMLTSFSLSGISPFVEDDAFNRLRLHRFRSAWSNEANHDVASFESLSLERTWAGMPASYRFGQTGSLPVRNFHPFIAVEDTQAGVFWGAQIAWHGSWQLETYRKEDAVSISGGLGDFERAHWMKEIEPGERFEAPIAIVSCCSGTLDDFCHRLVQGQESMAYPEPPHEADLPIVFNEWCSSWGHPTHDYLLKTADRLAETECRYLVIDDGWAEKPEHAEFQFNGDWNVDTKAFPAGLAATCRAIRARGLIPGIWFEFEPCTEGTEAFKQTDHQLRRHGETIQVGNRHFWDFRDPWTFEYLSEKVIRLLKENDFGYLKVDYNDSIGVGCDGAESLGEGLRQHLVGVRAFFKKIRREVPDLVIENCSSGGHRLEPGMIGLTSMSSSTDAHETVEIPIIGAQLHRLLPPSKNQLWAVLRPDDTQQRVCYSLSATFLGRMCISGDLIDILDANFELLKEAQAFYLQAVPILRKGKSQIIDHTDRCRRYPKGWQALIRQSEDEKQVLVVVHTFDLVESGAGSFEIPLLGQQQWQVSASFNSPFCSGVVGDKLILSIPHSFYGAAFILKCE